MSTTVSVDGVLDLNWKFEEIFQDNHFVTIAMGNREFSPEDGSYVKLLNFSDLVVSEDPLSDKFYFASFDEKKELP